MFFLLTIHLNSLRYTLRGYLCNSNVNVEFKEDLYSLLLGIIATVVLTNIASKLAFKSIEFSTQFFDLLKALK